MICFRRRSMLCCFVLILGVSGGLDSALAQNGTSENDKKSGLDTVEVLKQVDKLVEQNRQLEKANRELMDEIGALRQALAEKSPAESGSVPEHARASAQQSTREVAVTTPPQQEVVTESRGSEADSETREPEESKLWGSYTPNRGFRIANTEHGDLNLSIYTYVRYLNQLGLDSTYTDAFANLKNIQRRQDFQIQKVQIKFLGWLFDEKFRYFLYAWTSNASQGLGAQVVLAGNVNYTFNKHFNLAGGITSLPGTRSVEGNFPFWLGVDTRLIADEFFRPSYTSGVWARGEIVKKLNYQIMLGNNLSTLGVSAAQLDNGLNTVATALIWNPTSGEFGSGFGDFEHHDILAARLAAHFTRSDETKQSQPNNDQFENTQIRLEDGSVIFTPNLFAQGTTVNTVTYKMAAFDAGLKYRGLSLDGEYFLRWLDHFTGPGTEALAAIFSHGFQMQGSVMIVPKTVQAYLGGSTVHGKYGSPWDFRSGVNVFPWHNKVVRWNSEFLYVNKSPVGYTSVPFALGATGPIFHTNLELAF
ncbi:MAG TPA: hypothetical protein VEG30_13215 [Terriglobales bacterium]|nr:hypothetical protein [Terriglobales bacterium]